MTAVGFPESTVECAALQWFDEPGYEVIHGPAIGPDELMPTLEAFVGEVV